MFTVSSEKGSLLYYFFRNQGLALKHCAININTNSNIFLTLLRIKLNEKPDRRNKSQIY